MSRKKTKTEGIEPYVIECMCRHISERESLQYLEDKGYSISRSEFYTIKKEIEDNTVQRLNLIASKEFMSQHIQRLDMLKTIQTELWSNYHKEQNPSKKCNILMQLAEIQVYLSSYHDSTRYVIEQAAKKELKVER